MMIVSMYGSVGQGEPDLPCNIALSFPFPRQATKGYSRNPSS
jgi:hypothetical protein